MYSLRPDRKRSSNGENRAPQTPVTDQIEFRRGLFMSSYNLDAGRSIDMRISSPDVTARSTAGTPRSEAKDEVSMLRTNQRQLRDKCSELEKALEDAKRRESLLSRLQESTINLMQTMQRSHDEATAVLTSRIKSLEGIVEPCRREAAEALEVKEKLQAKESECDELVNPNLHVYISVRPTRERQTFCD